MKRVYFLLAFALVLGKETLSQTNGWFQYAMLQSINQIVKDGSDNLHLATDIGYIKYNTTTQSVVNFFNLTSQATPVGKLNSVAVNSTNGNIALAYPLQGGIAIHNGTTITNYDSFNSDLGEYDDPKLFYASDGTLYIYNFKNYQTFKDGVFSTIKTMASNIRDIVENNDGTKIFFATSSNGLFELTLATENMVNYTVGNSSIVSDWLHDLFVDANDVLHIGTIAGLSTLTNTGTWTEYKQQIPNSSSFYEVFSVDKNTNGDVLLSHYGPNYSRGYSILDTSNSQWTTYDDMSTSFCNSGNLFGFNHILYVGNDVYTDIGKSNKLASLTPGNTGCTFHDLNYLGIEEPFSNNVYSITIDKNASDNTMLDIGYVDSQYFGWIYKHLTIPMDGFNGTFPTPQTVFNKTQKSWLHQKSTLTGENRFISSDSEGLWIQNSGGGSPTFIAHGQTGFTLESITRVATRNTTGDTNAADNKIQLVIEGNNSSFQKQVFKTECDFNTNSCTAFEEIFTDRDYNEGLKYECSDQIVPGEVTCISMSKKDGNTQFTRAKWDVQVGGQPTIEFNDDISTLNPNLFGSVRFLDLDNPNLNATDTYNPSPCFTQDTPNDNDTEYKCRGLDMNNNVVYADTELDSNNDNAGEKSIKRNTIKDEDLSKTLQFIMGTFLVASSDPNFSNNVRKQFRYAIAARNPSSRNNNTFTFKSVTDSELNNLPKDFTVTPPVNDYFCGNNLYAVVLNTNYGILIKPKVDFTNVTLSTEDETITDALLFLYPNPSNETVSIKGVETKSITLYNVSGKRVLYSDKSNFQIRELANGIYFAKIVTTENHIVYRKLVKN